jgi:hypothetical protein
VDVGLSVSRVGGKAQKPALRGVSGRVRLDYAQFQELEMFTRFGGISNARVRGQIARAANGSARCSPSRATPGCGLPTRWRCSQPCRRRARRSTRRHPGAARAAAGLARRPCAEAVAAP